MTTQAKGQRSKERKTRKKIFSLICDYMYSSLSKTLHAQL